MGPYGVLRTLFKGGIISFFVQVKTTSLSPHHISTGPTAESAALSQRLAKLQPVTATVQKRVSHQRSLASTSFKKRKAHAARTPVDASFYMESVAARRIKTCLRGGAPKKKHSVFAIEFEHMDKKR